MTMINAVRRHYAQYLGQPSASYLVSAEFHPDSDFEITEYENTPRLGVTTLATVGFSVVPLHMFRQEYIFVCYEHFVSDNLLELLIAATKIVAESQHPLLQGNVLGPAGPILDSRETDMEALYSTIPIHFSDEFQIIPDAEAAVDIDIGWLMPIHRSEAIWIDEHGYQAFEELLEKSNISVFDLQRPPVV